MEHLPPNAPDEFVLDGGSGDEIRFRKVQGKGKLLVYEASMSDIIRVAGVVDVSASVKKPEVTAED